MFVHAEAERLGLCSESTGVGSARRVVVRRKEVLPECMVAESAFVRHYVGLSGDVVESVAAAMVDLVPESFRKRREAMRQETQHHITLFSQVELDELYGKPAFTQGTSGPDATASGGTEPNTRELSAQNTHALLDWLRDNVEDDWVPLGLGCTRRPGAATADGAHASQPDVFFMVVRWPGGQRARRMMGLSEADFHITLGFRDVDVHGVRKDETTIISPWKAPG